MSSYLLGAVVLQTWNLSTENRFYVPCKWNFEVKVCLSVCKYFPNSLFKCYCFEGKIIFLVLTVYVQYPGRQWDAMEELWRKNQKAWDLIAACCSRFVIVGIHLNFTNFSFLICKMIVKELDYKIRFVFLKICVFDDIMGDTGKSMSTTLV